MNYVVGYSLKAIHFPPFGFPRTKVISKPVGGSREALQQLLGSLPSAPRSAT